MGAALQQEENRVILTPPENLCAQEIRVPGDISSAAFFLVAAAIVPDAQVTIRDVGVNETRSGIIDVLGKQWALKLS